MRSIISSVCTIKASFPFPCLTLFLRHSRGLRVNKRCGGGGGEKCVVFVWEIAGGNRSAAAGPAERRKERLFKRLPTESCSPILPPWPPTDSPLAGGEIFYSHTATQQTLSLLHNRCLKEIRNVPGYYCIPKKSH